MERVMSVEERIKRAEDIYNRRNGVYTGNVSNTERLCKRKKRRNPKRLLIQIVVCLLIYVIFYAITNRNYIFSEEFRNSVSEFLNEKTNIIDLYEKVKEYIQIKLDDEEKTEEQEEKGDEIDEKKDENKKTDENEANEENKENEKNEEEKNKEKNTDKDENIGGAIEHTEDVNKESKENKEKLTGQQLMEKEAKEIKKNIKFIRPLNGRISSSFGWRNPTTSSVPKYHTGVDIAAVEGTKIKSATDGKVILASSLGDYGNHYQIQIKDIVLVYAHCKKLYLKEGDSVKQGQEIAEVGTTGNSTGPHLHFEIRKNKMKIDPQLVLNL